MNVEIEKYFNKFLKLKSVHGHTGLCDHCNYDMDRRFVVAGCLVILTMYVKFIISTIIVLKYAFNHLISPSRKISP